MKISIIMPVYNAEKFLENTIQSIINQTYQNWELIIIDDCSKDNSYSIAKTIAEKEPRIRVYKNETNLGISGNRNKGMKYATGEYIAFCDDDDLSESDLLLDNVHILEKYENIDMIKFGRRLVSVDAKGTEFDNICTKMELEGLIEENNKYDIYFLVRKSDTLYNLWNGLYRKKMLQENNIVFDESMKFGSEDADFSYKCYLKSKRIYINPKTYYIHYKRDASSTSRKYNKNKIDSVLTTMDTEFKIWENINFDNIDNQYYRIIALNINIDNIMFSQVFHKNSKMNYSERKNIYNKIKVQILDSKYVLTSVIKKKLRKENRKHYIISLIINTGNYFIIDIFYKMVSKIKNKKWK